jgi:tRNA 2-thiouridine synthesizing protein A
MDFNKELDARGLNCPLPILRCKKGMAEIGAGEILKVMATDPGSVRDFQAFCKQTGHELLSLEESENAGKKEFVFHIRKRT